MVGLIDDARSAIHAALYELRLPSVALALRRALARGVDVTLFLESDTLEGREARTCLSMLEGVARIQTDARAALMHDKFIVVDSARVWTGSVNLTWTGCHLHYNESIVICDRRVAEHYEEQFARLLDGAPDAPPLAPVAVGGSRVACAFAPGQDRLKPWLDAVRDARKNLRVAAFSLTHPALVEAIAERAAEGLPVEIIVDTRLSHGAAGKTAAERLARAGCTMRRGGPVPSRDLLRAFGLPALQDVKIHHKLLVADGWRVVTGSANPTRQGVETNDENVLSIEASEPLAATFADLLDRAAAASRTDPPACEDEPEESAK